MKHFLWGLIALTTSCAGTADKGVQAAQGAPHEVVVVATQTAWESEAGDTLRSILRAPIPFLATHEPLFVVQRVAPGAFDGLVGAHRNVLNVRISPELTTSLTAKENVTAAPQIFVTLTGPTEAAVAAYAAAHRTELAGFFENAERQRAISSASTHNQAELARLIKQRFGLDMIVPPGYSLARQDDDFLWFRYEFPFASQGFVLYKFPLDEDPSEARNRFLQRVPGPADGSYMTLSTVFDPIRTERTINGRKWMETRGFWEVHGDFMGGPFVGYTTKIADRQVALDAYVYSPRKPKRPYLRAVEALVYTVQ